ncbi:hypothetical protein FPV67DRAFT_1518878 [Lyophyllum atratum]|nr:hypothetical protein FPV67DRAFT_1518878 [Lyophyllum atratum]
MREPVRTVEPVAIPPGHRALDALLGVGGIRTPDLEGNDLHPDVTYMAQRLKRNEPMETLNLSENKPVPQCPVAIAEALKHIPIRALKVSYTITPTVNTPSACLKRLFLSYTLLASTGAIAVAKFLPMPPPSCTWTCAIPKRWNGICWWVSVAGGLGRACRGD